MDIGTAPLWGLLGFLFTIAAALAVAIAIILFRRRPASPAMPAEEVPGPEDPGIDYLEADLKRINKELQILSRRVAVKNATLRARQREERLIAAEQAVDEALLGLASPTPAPRTPTPAPRTPHPRSPQ